MILLFLLILIAISVSAQEIQVYEVRDFSGGLVNSVANALMQDNQLTIMENLNVDPLGNPRRRPGLGLHYVDTFSLDKDALLSFWLPQYKKHYVIRVFGNYYPSYFDAALLMECDDASTTCTTFVWDGFYDWRSEEKVNNPTFSPIINKNLLLAMKKSEMILLDGEKVFPARPYAPGQPRVVVMDGSTPINGRVRYRYQFANEEGDLRSNLSAPSWEVNVSNGTVILSSLGPAIQSSTYQYKVVIYRSINGGKYECVDSVVMAGETYVRYFDNLASTSPADTTDYPWGDETNCLYIGCLDNWVSAPGSMLATHDSLGDSGFGVTSNLLGVTDSTCISFAYSVVFIDSAGRQSYASPPICETFTLSELEGVDGDRGRVKLDSIPVPIDSTIRKKILLRGLVGDYTYEDLKQKIAVHPLYPIPPAGCWFKIIINSDTAIYWAAGSDPLSLVVDGMVWGINNHQRISKAVTAEDSSTYYTVESDDPGVDFSWEIVACTQYDTLRVPNSKTQEYQGNFVILDTLDDSVTAYIDSIPYDSLTISLWCDDGTSPQEPDSFCYDDSTISFQPSAIEFHGSRLYAVGDESNPNRLYYSDFGRPTTWAPDHFMEIPSSYGEWLVYLLSIQNDRLLIFRQNSILMLSGLSYYQYSLDEIIGGIGLSALHTVSKGANKIFFAHETGVYEFSRFSTPDDRPVSWLIKNTVDSVRPNINISWGGIIEGDYWWSVPTVTGLNNKTYVWSEFPKPYWKCYRFGIQDVITYDIDTTSLDYRSERYIFLGSNDTLYRWGYTDTLDDDAGVRFQGTMKTKAFLEGPGRKKILWFEVVASGTMDTAFLTFYDNEGEDSVGFDTLVPDFSDELVDGVGLDLVVDNFAVRIQDNYSGDYKIKAIRFEWIPWDEGKKR